MDKKNNEIIPATTKSETALELASFISSAVPWIGSPVSNVLSGVSLGRKLGRVREILQRLSADLQDFKSEISEKYVNTEDFEELLENTLKKVAEERNEEKRKVYSAFLIDAVKHPGEPYDEQTRFLRTLEEIQGDHIQIIRALMITPENTNIFMGSPGQTLQRRLPNIPNNRIEELVNQLNDLRITNLNSLKTMMTASGAEDLRHSITPFGERFVRFILSN